MMLCLPKRLKRSFSLGENDFTIVAPGYTFMGNALAADGMLNNRSDLFGKFPLELAQ
jgi:hypothetical protein